MYPITHTKPAALLIFNIILTFALANVALYFLIVDSDNRAVWTLVLIVLSVGCFAFITTACRQRVTIHPEHIEFQGLWDHGSFQRNDIKSIDGRIQTVLTLNDKSQHKLPAVHKLTPILRSWINAPRATR